MQATAKTLRLVTAEPPGELETLFRDHHDRVFRAAHRITGSPADAEDVLQTVFLRLVKSEGAYDLSDNPAAYLSRAAINASLDLMRAGRGRDWSNPATWSSRQLKAAGKIPRRSMLIASCKC